MILVINEWIFHDLLLENGADAFRETQEFVKGLFSSDDKIVMPTEVRWRGKAYQLMTDTRTSQREISKLLHGILRDPDKCLILYSCSSLVVPQESYDWAPLEDVYLLEAYDASNADLLVTTDETLFSRVAEHGQFACRMRDDFLAGYGISR